MTRRDLLLSVPALMMTATAANDRFTKSICSVIFPKDLPRPECFKQAKAAGFDAIELAIGDDFDLAVSRADARRLGEAAHDTGIAIASIWVSQPFQVNPLNSDDPAARARGLDAIRRALEIANDFHCGALLLYPGRVGSGPRFEHSYFSTWQRFSEELSKILPDAEHAKVVLTPENVWNKFLLSPIEMRAFVDQFHSPWLQAHFDVGNVMQYGYPEDWIQTLGPRIKRVHFKDYKLSNRTEQGHFADLLEGDVNWKAVMAALVASGYRGTLSPEITYDAAQPDQLKRTSAALDKILALAPAA